jgi:hypothetical protein
MSAFLLLNKFSGGRKVPSAAKAEAQAVFYRSGKPLRHPKAQLALRRPRSSLRDPKIKT